MNNEFNNIYMFFIVPVIYIRLICVFCGEPIRQIIKYEYTVSYCEALTFTNHFDKNYTPSGVGEEKHNVGLCPQFAYLYNKSNYNIRPPCTVIIKYYNFIVQRSNLLLT